LHEQEKSRIARELHDNIGGTLTSLAMYLESTYMIFPEEALWLERKHRIQELIRFLAEANRKIQAQLQPHVLHFFGLKAAILDQVCVLEEHADICTRVSLPDEEITVTPEQKLALYRMMQEMLTNHVLQARPSEINIILDINAAHVALTVSDNAVSSAPNNCDIKNKYSLDILRERARYFGGKLRVFIRPGKGRQMTISMPIHSDSHVS